MDGNSVLSHDDGEMALLTGTLGLRAWHCQASYRNFWVKTDKEMERSLSGKRNVFRKSAACGGLCKLAPRWASSALQRPHHSREPSRRWSILFPARGIWGLRTKGSIAGE